MKVRFLFASFMSFLLWTSSQGTCSVEKGICTETKQLLNQLQSQQYAVVDFDLSQQEVQDSIKAFKDFLALPEVFKEKINHRVYKTHRRGWMGYQRRSQESGDGDSKEFFHYHPFLEGMFQPSVRDNIVVQKFLKKANVIWRKAYDKLGFILKEMNKKFPGTYDHVFKTREEPIHLTLRFLKYDLQSPAEKIARSHFDVGTCTLAIAESHPGLRIGSQEATLKPVTHKPGSAVFFLAQNFEAMLGTGSNLLPAWHDVVQINTDKERWAIVVFADLPNNVGASKEATHKDPALIRLSSKHS
jgi:isopenicillin N synthase-like dioxygenase